MKIAMNEKLEKELEETYKKEMTDLTEQVGKIIEEYGTELLIGCMFLDARKRRKIIKEIEKEQRQKEKKERKKRL